MKSVQLAFTLFAFAFSISAIAQQQIGSDAIHVTISGETTRDALMVLRQDLQAAGVDFRYEPNFDQERRLVSIRFRVLDSQTGAELGNAESPANLQAPGARVGFRLARVNGALTSVCFGTCE